MKKNPNKNQPQVNREETGEILRLASLSLDFEGDLVELGCYEGDTSLCLAELLKGLKREKRLFIYDSFEGLPDKTEEDFSVAGAAFKKGELFVTKKEVKARFLRANLPVPVIKKGWFEDLDPEVDLPEKICFAFLDGDLYGSIKVSLELVENKMVSGGVIVVHDYNNPELPGVAKAVDEWLDTKKYKFAKKYSLAVLTREC